MIGQRYEGIGLDFLLRRRREDSAADVRDLQPLLERKLAETYPRRVKRQPTVYTRTRLGTARENVRRHGWARDRADLSLATADKLLHRPLAELAQEMPPPNLERGWNNYCPHCDWWGHGLAGDMDIAEHPWQVGCPACKKMIPGFDARAYLLSGRDSRGWFVAESADAGLLPRPRARQQRSLDAMKSYSYHYWHWGFSPCLEALADAFVFTGERKYASHALGLLVHFAHFFPYYCKKDIVNGDTHPGELIMDCYEAMLMKTVALAYDKLFLAMDVAATREGAVRLMQPHGIDLGDGHALRTYIEGRIFKTISRDMTRIWFMDGGTTRYRDHMAYEAIGLVLGDTPLGKRFQREAARLHFQGFGTDGSATVGGLGYDKTAYDHVVEQHLDLVKYCRRAPKRYLHDDSVRAAAHFYFDLYCLGRYFPNYGDGTYCAAPSYFTLSGLRPFTEGEMAEDRALTACRYAELYAATGVERFAAMAWDFNGNKADGLHLGILDREPEKIQGRIARAVARGKSSLEVSSIARDIGFCVLKSGRSGHRRALWMRANRRNQVSEAGWHGHADSMNLGLFGLGLDLLPDVGYMDQKHWVFGHNTVCRQDTPLPGAGKPQADLSCLDLPLPLLSEASEIGDLIDGIQFARCDGAEFPDCRRTCILVDAGDESFYIIDHIHVGAAVPERFVTYSFHTQQGKVSSNLHFEDHTTHLEAESRMSGKWLKPTRTATGEQICKPWWVRVAVDDTYGVLADRCDVQVRFTSLRPVDHLFHTWYMPQQKLDGTPQRLPYFLLSLRRPRQREQPRRFTTVIEPYRGRRCVSSAQVVPAVDPEGENIEIRETGGRRLTLTISDVGPQVRVLSDHGDS